MRLVGIMILLACCSGPHSPSYKTRVIFDSDTNNELDDQHALAYLLFNGETFDVAGITVNATRSGGNIDLQYAEAERVTQLCGFKNFPLYKGANESFRNIITSQTADSLDGTLAVDFIIGEGHRKAKEKLRVIAVGKLTNLALALRKDPYLEDRIHIIWLGSNYPDPGEYNLDNDTASANYVLKTNVELEIVTVRYGKPDGSDVVRATKDEIMKRMSGRGPKVDAIEGRHGGEFRNFGDYSVNLFENVKYNGNPPSRALFDMVAVAIAKNPQWGQSKVVHFPLLINNQWVEHPQSSRTVTVWHNFDKQSILDDFYKTMEQPVSVSAP